jgi:hypothetical protein
MFLERVIGVFKLDVNTFEEVEHDANATIQAAMVVAAVAFLSAVGSAIGAIFGDGSIFGSFFGSLIWHFVGWFLWSAITYFVGTSLFNGKATIDEMLRVIGFAQAPLILGIIPCLGWFVGWIWALIASFIAIRQGLDLDNVNAFLTIAVGFVVYLAGSFVLGLITGGFSLLF